jgi:hypothetical protein
VTVDDPKDNRPDGEQLDDGGFELAEPYQPPAQQGAAQQGGGQPQLGERLGQEMGYRPEGIREAERRDPAERPLNVYAIRPEAPQKSIVLRLIIVALLIAAAVGGYYAYCRYKMGNKIWELELQARELHNDLAMLNKLIDPPDITKVVLKMAADADVEATANDIVPSIEPLNNETSSKLPPVIVQGMKVAQSAVPVSGDVWVVGFSGRFRAKHGIVKKWFLAKRYTWFQMVDKRKYPLE